MKNKNCLLCQGKTVTIPDKTLAKKLCAGHLCQVMEIMLKDIIITPMRRKAEARKKCGWA